MEIAVEQTIKRPRGRPKKIPVSSGATVPVPPIVHAPPERYVVTKNGMAGYGGGGLYQFEAGQVIDDPFVIGKLLEGKVDFIAKMDANTKIVTCPHCRKKLPVL